MRTLRVISLIIIYMLIFSANSFALGKRKSSDMTIPSLQDQLGNFRKEQSSAQIPPEVKKTMEKAADELAQENIPAKSLSVGDKIPLFELPDATNRIVSISAKLTEGPVVISFYRGGWCPYCNLELRALQQSLPNMKALGASLVAISPGLPETSIDTKKKHNLEFDVLSDIGNKIAHKFGIVFTLNTELQSVYKDFGIDLEKFNGDATHQLPVPATYIVDTNGTIVYSFVDTDYTKRLEPSIIISVLESLKK